MKERIMQRRHMMRMIHSGSSQNPITVFGGGCGFVFGLTTFEFGGYAIEEFDFVHGRFGIVFGGFLDFECVEEEASVGGGGWGVCGGEGWFF